MTANTSIAIEDFSENKKLFLPSLINCLTETQDKTNVEIIQSFQKLRSHPFGASWVDIQREARRLRLRPQEYKQKYQAWERGQR